MNTAPPQVLHKRRYTQLHGSSDALALARLAEESKPLIVFCASAWMRSASPRRFPISRPTSR